MIDLLNLEFHELEELIISLNEKKFRAIQIFKSLHNKKIKDINHINNIGKNLIDKLIKISYINNIKCEKIYNSVDGTKKIIFNLSNDDFIETVFMPFKDRNSICISTQVGCKMGCKFCASTKNGLVRNLSSSEMLNQVYFIENNYDKIDNIVLMGIGEPLDNFDNLIKFIKIITDSNGRNISNRSITISTCGIVENIYKLAEEKLNVNLAISLHYAIDKKRLKFMPIQRKWNIEQLIKSCDYYFNITGRRVSFEYVVIDKINNTEYDALKLYELFKEKNIHINLIPLHNIKEFDKNTTSKYIVNKFYNRLKKLGLNVTIRKSMGFDINASCGQLRNKYIEENNAI